jgi:Icc-related predicted phosphoesterase
MRIQIFSDIHSDLAALKRNAAVEADLYLCAGDLCNWQRGLDACGEILQPLADKLWVMPGNHETAEQIAEFCAKFGFQDFHAKSFERGGWHFAGLGYSNPTPFDTPGEYSEEELAGKLASFAALDPLVLVCHAPPAGTPLDEAGPAKHFGSRAVADFLAAHPPAHFFCGHIHEAAGRDATLGPTRARNVGKRGYLLEL